MTKAKVFYNYACQVCSGNFTSTYRRQKFCPACKAEGNKRYELEKRVAKGTVPLGASLRCHHCSGTYAKRFLRQKYCDACTALSTANKLPASKEWNRNYQREYQKRRRQESAKAAIDARMAAGIRNSLANGKEGRSWESLVGYTIADLMPHLEAQFLPGMSWYNRAEWHIDHRRPLVSFQFQTPDDPQFREAWALTNLQPLWARDNLSKGGRWTPAE